MMNIIKISIRKKMFEKMKAAFEKNEEVIYLTFSEHVRKQLKTDLEAILFVNGFGDNRPKILAEISSYRTNNKSYSEFSFNKVETDQSNINKVMQLYYSNKNKAKLIKAA